MARLNINIGQSANDKNGDPLRTAFSKVNANFTELYAGAANETQLTNGATTVSLNLDGTLSSPNGIALSNFDTVNNISATARIDLGPNGSSNISLSGGIYNWTFVGSTGAVTFPDFTSQTTAWTGASGITWPVRSVGSVAGAGTVTLNYSTDRLVRATATGSTLTIAHSNIAAGKVVDLVISNTSGSTCIVTYGVGTGNTVNGSATTAVGAGTTRVFTCRSFGTTTTDVYVTIV